MLRFSDFDARGYRMVDVRTGYGEWFRTYDETVEDAMDIALLDEMRAPSWRAVRRAADLGCGTGRTAAWAAPERGGRDRRRRPQPRDAHGGAEERTA
jgi:ubiquinone/menaquinone biosynthesis C-methylase UbiE